MAHRLSHFGHHHDAGNRGQQQQAHQYAGDAVVQEQRHQPGAHRESGERAQPLAAGCGGLRLRRCARSLLLLRGRLGRLLHVALHAEAPAAAQATRLGVHGDQRQAAQGDQYRQDFFHDELRFRVDAGIIARRRYRWH